MMDDRKKIEVIFKRLARSKFRSHFRLRGKDWEYLRDRGMYVVLEHGEVFVKERLAPALPKNDGKQTPMRGHPIFVAQHATGTCCRSCLRKWHGIEEKQELNNSQIKYVINVLKEWLLAQEQGYRSEEEKGNVKIKRRQEIGKSKNRNTKKSGTNTKNSEATLFDNLLQ